MKTLYAETQLERQLEDLEIDFLEAISDCEFDAARVAIKKLEGAGASMRSLAKFRDQLVEAILEDHAHNNRWDDYYRLMNEEGIEEFSAYREALEDHQRTELQAIKTKYA